MWMRSRCTRNRSNARRPGSVRTTGGTTQHFKPKDLYPEVAFVWRNYLYACGGCNGGKSYRFSVIAPWTGELMNITRPRGARVTPPSGGAAALIDPRRENPLDFIILDLRGTFEFTPVADAGTLEYRRADYTIGVLRLNERDYLTNARKEAMVTSAALLARYVELRQGGAPSREVARLMKCIQRNPHPTVWEEMKRQHTRHVSLSTLFSAAPDALGF